MSEITYSLSFILAKAITSIWTKRAEQEAFFDLGERKKWTDEDFQKGVKKLAYWLHSSLLIPLEISPVEVSVPEMAKMKDLGNKIWAAKAKAIQNQEKTDHCGVSHWLIALAPLVGIAPKPLANSVSVKKLGDNKLQLHRLDHRWLRVIARICQNKVEKTEHEAWIFHERSPEAITFALGSIAARIARSTNNEDLHLDIGDSVWLLSLVALWQRRKSTDKVRGNRGKIENRRTTPKPIAKITQEYTTLFQPSQLEILVSFAREFSEQGEITKTAAKQIITLALEIALTEAHLSPHSYRKNIKSGKTGFKCLDKAKEILRKEENSKRKILSDEMIAIFKFRIYRMCNWRDQENFSSEQIFTSHYVRLSYELEKKYQQRKIEGTNMNMNEKTDPIDPREKGILMLLPQLRSYKMM